MTDEDLSLWQRYGKQVFGFLALGVVFLVLKLLFPDLDFSRDGSGRWILIGSGVALFAVVYAARRLWSSR